LVERVLTLHDSLVRLVEAIRTRLDTELRERTGADAFFSPPVIHRLRVAVFSVSSYEEINCGDAVVPRVGWSAREGYVYGEEGVERFVGMMQNTAEFEAALGRFGSGVGEERDRGTFLLYLTCFVYFVTKALLEDRRAPAGALVDAFLKDVEGDHIRATFRLGLAGVSIKGDPVEISTGVTLRRLGRSDYHGGFEVLVDQSIHRATFPSEYTASSFLEISVRPGPRMDGLYQLRGFIDVRLSVSIREFDLLIQQLMATAGVWRGTLDLVQSDSDPKTRVAQIEVHLPTLSPDRPVYRWEQRYQTFEPLGTFLVSKDAAGFVDLSRSLVERGYYDLVYARDGRDTPLSLAHSRYVEILHSREVPEKTIGREVEALEAFFTPEPAASKVFIERVAHLMSIIAKDENDTENLLQNAYRVRSSYTHKGVGWEKFVPIAATTKEAGYAWDHYKGKLARILLTYLRLSVVSRILTRLDDMASMDLLRESARTSVPDPSLAGQSELLACKIPKVDDFIQDEAAAERFHVPLGTLRSLVADKKIAAITLLRPSQRGKAASTNLIPEWALLELTST
jgi:hypothetical protein